MLKKFHLHDRGNIDLSHEARRKLIRVQKMFFGQASTTFVEVHFCYFWKTIQPISILL